VSLAKLNYVPFLRSTAFRAAPTERPMLAIIGIQVRLRKKKKKNVAFSIDTSSSSSSSSSSLSIVLVYVRVQDMLALRPSLVASLAPESDRQCIVNVVFRSRRQDRQRTHSYTHIAGFDTILLARDLQIRGGRSYWQYRMPVSLETLQRDAQVTNMLHFANWQCAPRITD
jgi:hypothetical protein